MSQQNFTTTDPAVCVDLRVDATGFGSIKPQTVIDIFQDTVSKHGHRNAMATKQAIDVRIKNILKQMREYNPRYQFGFLLNYINIINHVGREAWWI